MPWYQSKYAKAFLVAFCTGLIAAAVMYLGIVDDVTIGVRQTIKIVGLAFMAPFATLVRFLPSFDSILGAPQVGVAHADEITVNPPDPTPEPPVVHTDVPSDRPAVRKPRIVRP